MRGNPSHRRQPYHILGVVGSHSGWLQPLYEMVLWHNIGSVLGSVRLVIRLQMEPDTRRGKPQKTPFRSWLRSTSEKWIAIWLNKGLCSRTKAFVQAGSGERLYLDPHFDPHSESGPKQKTFSGSAGLAGKMFAHRVGVACPPQHLPIAHIEHFVSFSLLYN